MNASDKKEFEDAQNIIKDMVKRNTEMLDAIEDMVKDSEHPRAIEVYNQMVKATGDMGKDLIKNIIDKNKVNRPAEGPKIGNAEEPKGMPAVLNREEFPAETSPLQTLQLTLFSLS